MDTLNVILALLALTAVVVAVFVTRNHRHDFVSLGVPILGIVFALIPMARLMRTANDVPRHIAAQLSASDDADPLSQTPCGSRGDSSEWQTRAMTASIVKELGAIRPFDLFSSFGLGVLSSVAAAVLLELVPRRKALKS